MLRHGFISTTTSSSSPSLATSLKWIPKPAVLLRFSSPFYYLPNRRNTTGPGRAFVNAFVQSVKRQVKENQQLNENMKLISAEASKLTESDSLKKAKEIMEKANQEGSAVSSKAIKKTAEVAKKVAHTVAETPIAKAATTTIKVTANVLEQAARTTARPIVESETYQQLSKQLAQAIQDASSRYGGVSSKEYRDLIKQQRLLNHMMFNSTTCTSSDLVLHPTSSSSSSSSSSPFSSSSSSSSSSTSSSLYLSHPFLVRKLHQFNEVLKKSDQLWISWPRWIFYRMQSVLAPLLEGTEMSRAMTKFKKIDPQFNLEHFLKEAREFMLPEILDAWLSGDKDTLALWCCEASLNVLTAPNEVMSQQHLISGCKLIELTTVDAQAKLMDNQLPVLIVTFQTQEILVFKDATTKEVKVGKEDHILKCNYILVMTLEDTFPIHPITKNWRVMDQSKHALGATL